MIGEAMIETIAVMAVGATKEEATTVTVVMTEATTGVMIAITTGGMMEKTTEGMTVVMNGMTTIDVTIEVMIGAMTVSLTEVIAVMTAMNPTAIAVQLERKTTLL